MTSTQKKFVRTGDGTFHLFAQVGTQPSTCNGTPQTGLLWFTSTDAIVWTCSGQISTDTTLHPSVTTDTSDNIYTVYSKSTTGGGTDKNVFFRKFTKGVGSTWTIEQQQTVMGGSSTEGYHYAVIELDGADTLWIAARHFDGTNYNVRVYNSNGTAPDTSWSQSIIASEDVPNADPRFHYPVLVDFADKIGLIYSTEYNNLPNSASLTRTNFNWRFRKDSDPKDIWTVESFVRNESNLEAPEYTALGEEDGTIHLATVDKSPNAHVHYYRYNGDFWNELYRNSTNTNNNDVDPGVALTSDGTNIWIFRGDTDDNLLSNIEGPNRVSYIKGRPSYRQFE